MSRVLLVGEDRIVILDIEQALKRSGYDVKVVIGKMEGLQEIALNVYDLIILCNIPKGNGEKFYNQVHAFSKEAAGKILFVTANLTRFIKSSGNLYVVKPFTDEELLEAVKKLLP